MKVLLEADGGSRGNPGPAGYGALVRSADRGEVLAETKEAIGRATNNVAEYRGLIAGLEAAARIGATDVEVRMDSKLVVEQMAGNWKVKHPDLAVLHRQAQQLAAAFDHVSYTWVPRAQNSAADALANQAMDASAESAAVAVNPAGWTGAKGAPTKLLLLRHGQTPLSVERRYSGRGNPALTDLGVRQAAAAADYLGRLGGIDAVVSSPLQRAHDTAAAAAGALGLDVEVDDDLIETDFGGWEGLTFREASERDPDLHRQWLSDTAVAPPEGESFDTVARRIARVQQRLVSERGGQTVLVVSHVTPIKTLLRMALDAGPAILYRLHLDLASLSIAEFYPDGAASVRLVNQTAYL
ncbi:bifunctional RNase H/acid phosphatase [Mycolicibacterium sp. 018/SC-01/001]|uniref:bifunctional RNase H/acid phosphatase n=1 Tax=Mycolicibacterium sp. 018/SC-01/001 TaxID=2592069 RepID=UPI0011806D78|nr:bifunctional RNase H/acid phosphatase [Mycolicibacterium sp. 018/SC-01/001]TRW88252.1 bifunctional RNase H/acid phosphatase [Mycolicibacterium sp. 018/SC-01/001]